MKVLGYRILLCVLVGVMLVVTGLTISLHNRVGGLEEQLSELKRDRLQQLVITVNGLDSGQGRPGQYFQFDPGQLDSLIGRDRWEGRTFVAVIPGKGLVLPVRFWTITGEKNQGVGRSENDMPTLDWKMGDKIVILLAP